MAANWQANHRRNNGTYWDIQKRCLETERKNKMLIKWKCKPDVFDGDVKIIYDYLIANADNLDETDISFEEVRRAWLIFSDRGDGRTSWKDVTGHNLWLFSKWLMGHYRESEGGCKIYR